MLKYILIILTVLFLIFGIYLARNVFLPQKTIIPFITPTQTNITGFLHTPTVNIIKPKPTVSTTVNCNTGSIRNENCPPGCVYYGMPLGCVSQAYYDNCKKGGNCPICLSSSTSIETEKGNINIRNLKIGMFVWTINKTGGKELQPIIKLSSTNVGLSHQMIHLIFSDNSEVLVSPKHPTITGKPIEDLIVGEVYDGKTIISKDLIPYSDTKTYDLLVAGDTGYYFTNGILLGSTLK